ncbi:acetyltransferase (GNAT) family protein [Streptomyces sp. 1114.5]|uniref:GNAT family N-acetyltransferase n=1 Tax=Streptomyces sp. 1114.5 TaxID=1938830 RepID=UPI000EB03B97|nr:GNAT family N-acetyltransferase [Streptomyces sp. 1114.5]RKT12060.1 acetyltransferase (GNAT) family protein [Streptomyces sp. 1114.5]
MSEELRIRLLDEQDWDSVVALEHAAYAADGLSEGREALQSRARSSPDTCFVLERHGTVVGYLLSLPYPPLRCPDLGRSEETVHRSANLHVHDLVIAEELRGREVALGFIRHFREQAGEQGFERISMVAVRGADILLRLLGYRAHREVAVPACYGRRAVYMSMPVG